jgi:hypothetical protein
MQIHISTTPFGRRALTLGQIASQATAKAMPKEAAANKWQVFQHIREAREPLWRDRSLSGDPQRAAFIPSGKRSSRPMGELIVWPSNEQLMAQGQWHLAGNASPPSGCAGGMRFDHSSRQSERQALRPQGAGQGKWSRPMASTCRRSSPALRSFK